MAERVPLDGEWRFKGYVGEDWAYRRAYRATLSQPRDVAGWLVGSVPGSVQYDLWQAGEIPNPYYGRNTLCAEWASQRAWVYRRTFTPHPAPDPAWHRRRVRLRFEGVDYEAKFFLNGEPLGEHASMFTPALFEVGDRLKYGEENLLAVVLLPAPIEQPQIGRTSLVRTHKTRMNYWWDFCPRLVHLGIWDHVGLEVTGPARIEDVFVRPQLAAGLKRAALPVSVTISAGNPLEVEVAVTVSFEGQAIGTTRSADTIGPGSKTVELTLAVDDPHLWWPNGAGGQPLYQAEVTIRCPGGEETGESDRRLINFGIRRVEFLSNETPDTSARPYTFAVNGRKIYVRGWNWVPMDLLYGVKRPAKLAHLIEMARRSGANLLRVWGGGLIEREEFYDACDRAGLMIWQEFIQSSSGMDNWPPEDPAMIDMMAREAENIIPRRRNHPSLVLWCGGNELRNRDDDGPAHGDEPMLARLEQVVRRLDPDRGWLPSSPSGRVFFNMLPDIARDPDGLHDAHGQWNYQGLAEQYTLYNAGTALFSSEFGVEGCANLDVLHASLPAAGRLPMSHDNPFWTHSASWWISDRLLRQVFGDLPDLPALVRASQYLQAEGLRYAVEANRRRQWRSSGCLPWQFDEPFPNACCTSVVDYFGRPKPAYYAVARAYVPLAIVASFAAQALAAHALAGHAELAAELHVISALNAPVPAHWRARLIDVRGAVLAEGSGECTAEAGRAVRVGQVRWPVTVATEKVLFLDLALSSNGEPVAANRYPFSLTGDLKPFLSLPRTRLKVTSEGDAVRRRVTVANRGGTAALNVRLEDARPPRDDGYANGYVYFSDNYFTLFPGEARVVGVEWRNVPEGARRLRVVGWNVANRML